MRSKIITLLIGFCLLSFFSFAQKSTNFSNILLKQKKDVITSGDELVIPPAFLALSPGAVTPGGWIKDWSETALSGITGHLDEWSPTFGEAWKAKVINPKSSTLGEGEDGTGWPLEQSSYWLDGALRLAYIMNDTALIRKVSDRLDLVVNGVLNGGETFIYWKPESFLKEGEIWGEFNNWAHSHMGRALVAYYQATGKQRILDALVKVYSNFQVPVYRNNFEAVSGIVNIDPMLDTYMMSGDKKILDQVLKVNNDSLFIEVTNNWVKGNIINGHGVTVYETIRLPAQLYPWTGNQQFLKATQSYLNWLDQNHMLPNGVASSEEVTAGIGSTRNIETCNVAASAYTYQKMYEISGNGNWGDRIEQVFFNAGPVPVARDFQTMCYYQSPNRIKNIIPVAEPRGHDRSCYVFKPLGSNVLCCVGNLNRVIPNYIMHMWMATLDNGIAATLYGPSEVNTIVGKDIPVKITSETNYPFADNIKLIITPERKVNFPLYLRIPEWCVKPSVKINQNELDVSINQNGFMVINRKWKKGDKIDIRFPMEVKVISGNETPYPQKTDYFKHEDDRKLASLVDINNPYKSVFYGPLLFALPIKDIDANTQAPNQHWNFALNVDEKNPAVEVIRNNTSEPWRWQLDSPIKLRVPAKIFDWKPTELQPLPKERISGGQDTFINLVPYGCTKFRISMFPVSE